MRVDDVTTPRYRLKTGVGRPTFSRSFGNNGVHKNFVEVGSHLHRQFSNDENHSSDATVGILEGRDAVHRLVYCDIPPFILAHLLGASPTT